MYTLSAPQGCKHTYIQTCVQVLADPDEVFPSTRPYEASHRTALSPLVSVIILRNVRESVLEGSMPFWTW